MEISIKSLIDEYAAMIASISKRMIENTAVAEEAAQGTWLEIAKSIDS